MKEIGLTKRLSLVALFVDKGSTFVDVGTDHAYLPIYLCKHEISRGGIAADINIGPLKIAERNLALAGLTNRVSLVLSNGLQEIDTDKVDTVIIAGMGGETIWSILENAHLDEGHNIILQPMTQLSALRKNLASSGFEILCEALAEEENKLYHVLKVKKIRRTIKLNDVETYVGSKYQNKNDCTYRKFIEKELIRLEKIKEGMKMAENLPEDELMEIEREYNSFIKAREEIL